jgi:hypothetical protein
MHDMDARYCRQGVCGITDIHNKQQKKVFHCSPSRWITETLSTACGIAVFSTSDRPRCFHNEGGKIRADAVSNAKRQLHRRIPQAPLDQAEHGFRYARTLGNRVIRETSAFALGPQEANYLFSDRFVMSDSRHAGGWQKTPLDIYFAIVKYLRLKAKRRSWLHSGHQEIWTTEARTA